MVKWTFNNPKGKPSLGMGLSEENIARLKAGKPIHVHDEKFFDGDIIISYGKTEEIIVEDLKKNFGGLDKAPMHPDTDTQGEAETT